MNETDLKRILSFLDFLYPDAKGELEYSTDYGLLIAVVLSAQATDVMVNKVTKSLFNEFRTLESIAKATPQMIEKHIRHLGLYKNKARFVVKIADLLLSEHNGKVPSGKNELMSLPGVGNKTANVVRAELFKIPEIAVDTHVTRVTRRLAIAKKHDDPLKIEKRLRALLPQERYIKTHHQLIHFGRYFCKARGMRCDECRLVDICIEKNKNLKKQTFDGF